MKLTRKIIKDHLETLNLMQVATYDDEPWIASVYYGFDSNLNLYFLSNPKTTHCQQIEANPDVSVAIVNSDQDINKPKKGLQLYGQSKQLRNPNEIKRALHIWKSHLKVKNPELTYENMVNNKIKGRMYIIKPKKIKYFNQELFRVEDGQEPLIVL